MAHRAPVLLVPKEAEKDGGDHLSQYLTDVNGIQETAHTAECWLMPTPETWTVLTFFESALAEQLDMDAMADDSNIGSWAPTGTDNLSLPSGPAQPYGPGATNVAAAQYNCDLSVTNQMVASSDQRSVTINQGLSLPEVGALVGQQVGQTQAPADAAFQNLRAESSSALSASAQLTHAANLRAESIRREANEMLRQSAEREAVLPQESEKLIQRADLKVSEAREETKKVRADADRQFKALAREPEGRIKEADDKARAAEERARNWAEQRVEEEKRRAQCDASA